MNKIIFNISMSLDGFVADAQDKVEKLHAWYFNGDVEVPFGDHGMVVKVSAASAQLLRELPARVGAMITGRRNFNLSRAWGGHPPLGVPHFVVTHQPPPEWQKEGSPFTFITDGINSVVRQAKAAAGDKDVCISSPAILQQCLNAGLVDELHIDLVPILLGSGIKLFSAEQTPRLDLAKMRIIDGTGVTHLSYQISK